MKRPIEIYSEPYPSCPHLKGTTCALLSLAIGRQAEVSTAFCNKICHGGEGVKDSKTFEEMVSAARSTWKARHAGERFLPRVLRSYNDGRAVRVPQWWEEARAVLSPLYAYSFVTSINLTGSAIYGEMPAHDIDLVIHVSDFESLTPEFVAALPKTLLGKTCDVFFRHEWYGLFPQLDCEKKILHVPACYPMEGRQVEETITVVRHDDDPDFKYIIDKIKSEPVPEPTPEPVPVPTPTPMPVQGVWTTKDRARGFGDLVAKATAAVGIKPCAPCKKRQEALNKLLPFSGQNVIQSAA